MKNLRKQHNGKGGFTLIEILVVMAIIGILLATAVPAIIGQIQKQKEGASAAKAHNLAIASFGFSNDNNQTYPSGGTSTAIFTLLYAGKYLQQPTDIYLGSGKITASEQNYVPVALYNSWDYVMNTTGASGLSGTDPTDLPLLFSHSTAVINFGAGANNATVTATSPWGTDGVTMCTLGQQASFVRPTANGTTTTVPLTQASFAPPTGAAYGSVQP